MRFHERPVAGDGVFRSANAVGRSGVEGADNARVVWIRIEQTFGLRERLGELLRAQQNVHVLNAGVGVFRFELHAALKQKLGLVQHFVAG